MASSTTAGRLTGPQYVRLATAISDKNMKNIAELVLDFGKVTIDNIASSTNNDPIGFNKEILHHWSNKNAGSDQTLVSTDL